MENWRVCQRCGATLEKYQIKWCKACSKEIKRERARLAYMSIDRKAVRNAPKEIVQPLATARTTIREEEILRLVRLYGPPYDSYGRLKAYLENMGKLPPKNCLRSEHPNVADLCVFRPTPGEQWF